MKFSNSNHSIFKYNLFSFTLSYKLLVFVSIFTPTQEKLFSSILCKLGFMFVAVKGPSSTFWTWSISPWRLLPVQKPEQSSNCDSEQPAHSIQLPDHQRTVLYRHNTLNNFKLLRSSEFRYWLGLLLSETWNKFFHIPSER